MRIDIFDVGHGACSVITAPNGKRIMIDCGSRRDEPYWWPSIHFYGQSLNALILANLDEDHVRDFGHVLANVNVGTVYTNDTIDHLRLRLLKSEGMQNGVESVYNYLRQPSRMNLAIDLSPMRVSLFRFPYGAFANTNNLSLITFVEYGQFCIVYPGDLEEDGWRRALRNSDFRILLRRVNVFVTSHHGRENGFCQEIFEECAPWAFIISDKEMVHDTQETTNWYRQRALGLTRTTSPWDSRYVFTTRNDGCLSITVDQAGTFVLQINSTVQAQNSVPLVPLPLLSNLLHR